MTNFLDPNFKFKKTGYGRGRTGHSFGHLTSGGAAEVATFSGEKSRGEKVLEESSAQDKLESLLGSKLFNLLPEWTKGTRLKTKEFKETYKDFVGKFPDVVEFAETGFKDKGEKWGWREQKFAFTKSFLEGDHLKDAASLESWLGGKEGSEWLKQYKATPDKFDLPTEKEDIFKGLETKEFKDIFKDHDFSSVINQDASVSTAGLNEADMINQENIAMLQELDGLV